MTAAAAARWMGQARPTEALCFALCLMLCALASCASSPELREQAPPPDPPFLGCTQSSELYVAQEQSLQSLRLDVSLKLEVGQGPSLQARWLLEAEQPVQALRLRLRPGLELDRVMLRQDGRALAPACQRWVEQAETALVFEEAVSGTFELELQYHSEQLTWKRELPLEQPVLVSHYAEFGEQLYLSSEDWYPRLPGVQAVAAGALTVEFPKQCLLGASGKPLSDTTKGELRSRVFDLDPPLPEQLSMGVVELCGGERLVPEKPLASTGVELLRQKQAASESFSVRTLDILVA
ncbi:MAG: hypothetical protein RBU37_09945, partial [Myxococcota bacterium]|nr:hypothetical protein [Myxococcota bacterium]